MSFNTAGWNRIRYSLYAPFYDFIARPLQGARYRAITLLDPKPGDSVLIVGGGTGLDLEALPSGVSVTLTDISPAMVDRARTRAGRLGRQLKALVMNGQDLRFPDETFDKVILHLILAVIPDPYACAREASRVLKRDGAISVLDKFLPDGKSPSLWRQLLNPLTNALFSNINRQLGPILESAGLEVHSEQPGPLGGLFRIVVAGKK